MEFHQNISIQCKVIQVLIFCKYVYKVKYDILGLNVNNFVEDRDILMKLHFQRALYYGIKW